MAPQKLIFILRKPANWVSIERVFAQVAKYLPTDEYDVEFQTLPHGWGIWGLIKNLLFFRRRPGDIYHITGDVHYIALRLPRKNTVLTIHDLVFLRGTGGMRRWLIKLFWLDLPLKAVDYVTVISEATRDEILSHFPAAEPKIRVIPDPLVDRFDAAPEKRFNAECPLLLQVGTTKHKNLLNLAKALRGVNCRLRIIGKIDGETADALRENGVDYDNAAAVDAADMAAEYRAADIVTFCSTYEGFGLPIVEGQAMRKPVITSDLAPMNEVAGGGAALADPTRPDSIRDELVKLISDRGYRERLIELGTENVKRFEPARVAREYSDLYRQILD